jgi:hypothetical protein
MVRSVDDASDDDAVIREFRLAVAVIDQAILDIALMWRYRRGLRTLSKPCDYLKAVTEAEDATRFLFTDFPHTIWADACEAMGYPRQLDRTAIIHAVRRKVTGEQRQWPKPRTGGTGEARHAGSRLFRCFDDFAVGGGDRLAHSQPALTPKGAA